MPELYCWFWSLMKSKAAALCSLDTTSTPVNPVLTSQEPNRTWQQTGPAQQATDFLGCTPMSCGFRAPTHSPHQQCHKLPPSTTSCGPLSRQGGYPKQQEKPLPESWSLRVGLRKETCFGKMTG